MKSSSNQIQDSIEFLCVDKETSVFEIMKKMSEAPLRNLPAGIVLVTDGTGRLIGSITDGDVRRGLVKFSSLEIKAKDIMNPNPITFPDRISFGEILSHLPIELTKRGRRDTKFLGKIILVDQHNRPTRIIEYYQLWEQRVATHRYIVILGMGYVGLTLALKLSEAGFKVCGVDIEEKKIEALRKGIPTIIEPGIKELLREQINKNFIVENSIPEGGDVFIISVGTPIVKSPITSEPAPDLSMLESASIAVGKHLKRGGLVILRSTVPLGASRNFVLPIIERESGLVGGTDFHLVFAPERTVEGAALAELRQLPQIIGGINSDSVEAAAAIFKELTPYIIRVESLEAAELVKLTNNSFRDYKFAFANYLTRICQKYNINIYELIFACNSGYPRDHIPYPSPGVGGPCLTKDPYILATALADDDSLPSLPKISRKTNEAMHNFVVESLISRLISLGKNPAECHVLVCGLAFKGDPETSDTRNSSPMLIAEELKRHFAQVSGYDPVVSSEEIAKAGIEPATIPQGFHNKDAILFLNNHPSFRKIDVFTMSRSMRTPGIIYDAWRLFRVEDIISIQGIEYMGLGFHRSK